MHLKKQMLLVHKQSLPRRVPDIELDAEATAKVEDRAHELLGSTLAVRMQGLSPWFSMWDDIEKLRGTEPEDFGDYKM